MIAQVPFYSEFIGQINWSKRDISDVKTVMNVAMTEECNALLRNGTPPKMSDPGHFSIPCSIGTHSIDNALCDLGASISVLPLSLALKLGLTKFTRARTTVRLADYSYVRVKGAVHDVPIRIGNFFIPVDFIVLNISEDRRDKFKDPGGEMGAPSLKSGTARIDDPGGDADNVMPSRKKLCDEVIDWDPDAVGSCCSYIAKLWRPDVRLTIAEATSSSQRPSSRPMICAVG
ncbi:UBA domain-containing protein Mud1-like [Silene latifolia]|uniref:UBA domain-containing protein Mud1-like n=1 Tax=Silene latifolia TaxID=37657 RepID=UPI003D78148A